MSFEAKLWRQVCRHVELSDSFARVAEILATEVPLALLSVRRLDDDPLRLTTLALAGSEHGSEAAATQLKSEIDGATGRELRRFLSQPGARVVDEETPRLLRALMPTGAQTSLVAAPLSIAGQPPLIVVLVLGVRRKIEATHVDVLNRALAPLAVAYENDLRLHEVTRMREALEADRAALLSRLGRSDLSDTVIGEGGGLKMVMERVQQVAPTDAPVLILGETGSGKEIVARSIHARSSRSKGPVVRVNCGAIPSELIDSELFGHEKGSFTGAVGTRKGWFERADGGTLFLDEIGELSLPAQVRLLRVLQDGSLERVGGHQTIQVDVRIVAATHRQLDSMVAAGTFREDLWYRLSVFPIRLPALRERIDDIAALAKHFAERAGHRLASRVLVPTEQDIALLQRYAWPGNVRELSAVIERAAILGNGKRLEIATALGANFATASPARATTSSVFPPNTTNAAPAVADEKLVTLDQAMAAHIERALASTHGRIEGPFGAAKALGVNPHTLRARMRKLGVKWSKYRDHAEMA